MRQVLNGMKEETVLDYAVFRLSPTRTRCEVLVSAGGDEEKLASGLLQPYCSHLQAIQEQVAQGCHSIVLGLSKENGDDKQTNWFTKGTVERFVRFVRTPEVLERVSNIEYELMILEEALSIQSQGNNEEGTLCSSNMATMHAQTIPRRVSGDGNTSDLVENARWGLLKTMEARMYMLQREQSTLFAHAVAAGFSLDHISDLIFFAEYFGGSHMREACIKYLVLYKKKREAGVWPEDMDLTNLESQPNFGYESFATIKPRPETWSDIHSEVGGIKSDDGGSSLTFGSNGGFYDGIWPADGGNSTQGVNGGLGACESRASYYNVTGDSAFSRYQQDYLSGLAANMLSVELPTSFPRHAQKRFYSGSHFLERAGSLSLETGKESPAWNHRHLVPGIAPELGRAVNVRGNSQEVYHYSSLASAIEQFQGLPEGCDPYSGMLPASEVANMPASHLQSSTLYPLYANGNYESYELQARHPIASNLNIAYNSESSRSCYEGASYVNGDQTSDQFHLQQKSHSNSASPNSKPDDLGSRDSLSRAAISVANVPADDRRVLGTQSSLITINTESKASIYPNEMHSFGKHQVGSPTGLPLDVIEVGNINYITSSNLNDSEPCISISENGAADNDDGDAGGEILPENAIQESSVFMQNESLSASGQGFLNSHCGRPGTDEDPEKEQQSITKLFTTFGNEISGSSTIPEGSDISNEIITEFISSGDSLLESKDQSLFRNVDQGLVSFEYEELLENPVPVKQQDSVEKDSLLLDRNSEPKKKMASRYGYIHDIEGDSQSDPHLHTRIPMPDSEIIFVTMRGSSHESQSVTDSGMAPQHNLKEPFSKGTSETGDSFTVPEQCVLQQPFPFGDQFLAECFENTSLAQTDELSVSTESAMIPDRPIVAKQSTGSREVNNNLEVEFTFDEQQDDTDEKGDEKSNDFSGTLDDLAPIADLLQSVHKPCSNYLDSDVNLLEGVHIDGIHYVNANKKEKPEESSERIKPELSSKKETQSSVPASKNENLARRRSLSAARGDKISKINAVSGSASGSQMGNTRSLKPTNPSKTKKEKEDEERKRLENLKMQRIERISARSNLSGPAKSAPSTSCASKPSSPGGYSNTKSPIATSPKTNNLGFSLARVGKSSSSPLNHKFSPTTLGRPISCEK